ncbi:MAG: zinc ribbon domain-containing protein [Syntrophorhabdaceae bacterium]|nr:zinc ribbon domain-containing protein [Syntrophorhabdaceae bacterium]
MADRKTRFCSNCGKKIDTKAEICPKCGVRVSGRRERSHKEVKNSGLAAILSFFIPGLGQIYNGQIGKGLLMIVALIVCIVLTIVIIGIFLWLILWLYGIYDAYNTARRINRGEIKHED